MTPQTIEPAIQEAILDILPADGPKAIELICQLLANMILSIDKANINDTIALLKGHLAAHEGT